MKYFFLLLISIYQIGCSGQSISSKRDVDYAMAKSKFEKKFTSHFPSIIETNKYLKVLNESPESNKLGLYLYEFEVNAMILDSLVKKVESENLTRYNWKDSCLLVVHQSETEDPFDEEPFDTSYSEKPDCLNKKLPIPNFIHMKRSISKIGFSMDSTFNIFVLESKAGASSEFKLAPLKSMPKKWENGFSRGYVISRDKEIVVYWMIIW